MMALLSLKMFGSFRYSSKNFISLQKHAETAMDRKLFVLFIFLFLSLPAAQQAVGEPRVNDEPKRCLVLDMDNKTLLNNADVAFSDGKITHTDAHGYFSLPDTFSYVIVAKNGYIRQKVERQLLGDTLYLLNASHCLPELTVVARQKVQDLNHIFHLNTTDMALIAQGQQLSQGFGLPLWIIIRPIVKLLSKKNKVDITRKVLDNY